MLNVAVPAGFNLTVPSTEVPSWNVTVPVGVPEPGAAALTVAVKVTELPTIAAAAELLRIILVAAWATVCTTCPLLAVKFGTPA